MRKGGNGRQGKGMERTGEAVFEAYYICSHLICSATGQITGANFISISPMTCLTPD